MVNINSFLVKCMTAAVVCLACLLLLAGCRKKPQPAPPPPKITVAQPLKRNVTYYLDLTGKTQAVNSVQLVARVPAISIRCTSTTGRW